jgi:hypothetical protein
MNLAMSAATNPAMNSRAKFFAVLLTAGALASPIGHAAPGGGAPSTTGLPPAASDAHRGAGSSGGPPVGSGTARDFRPNVPRVGKPFSGRPVPYRMDRDYGDSNTESQRIKQPYPYPYPYYSDTSRGNTGCNKYARRAIDTNNRNWWKRYQACIGTRGD